MKIEYYPKTDSLYLSFRSGLGVDIVQISDKICADLDAAGPVVGLDIQQALNAIDLSKIEVEGMQNPNFLVGRGGRA